MKNQRKQFFEDRRAGDAIFLVKIAFLKEIGQFEVVKESIDTSLESLFSRLQN